MILWMHIILDKLLNKCLVLLNLIWIFCQYDVTQMQQSEGIYFYNFLLLIIFLEIREKLNEHFTVDQALMALRTLKCKIYDSKIIVQEKTKIHKKIFELADLHPN